MSYESIILAVAVAALVYAWWRSVLIKKIPVSSAKAQEISGAIRQGAMAFLNREYRVLVVFVVIIAAALWALRFISTTGHVVDNRTIIAFIVGAVLSAIAGYIGMRVATTANVRTAEAVQKSVASGLSVAFTAGSISGLSVVAL